MEIKVREAKPNDFERLEEILKQNNMFQYPKIDGKKAMQRIYKKIGRYFLVAETPEKVVGFIRGVYDGSRAMIHQIAVDLKYQGKGIGNKLINKIAIRFKEDGALTLAVTVRPNSKNYFKYKGFSEIPITLMLHHDINSLIHNTTSS